jgi:hypothetical protein
MRADPTIAVIGVRQMRRMEDLVACATRRGLEIWDLLAYSALADTREGRLRLVALFPRSPVSADPSVLCLDGRRTSKHRNPPFEDGTFGKSAELCLYYCDDPLERRWTLEYGLLGLFDIARAHVANECEWRDTGRWPGVDAPHGTTSPAPPDQSIAAPAIAYRNPVLDYNRPPTRSETP